MEQQQHFGSNVNTTGLVYLREGATAGDTASPGTPPLSRQQLVTSIPSSIAASAASLLLRQQGGGAAAAAAAVSHAMPVDYSMYNLWQQQQQQNQHHLTGLPQHSHLLNNNNVTSNGAPVISTTASTSGNSTTTNNNASLIATASSSMLTNNTHHQHNHHQHHHQHQSSHHNNHQQLQLNNTPHHHHQQQQQQQLHQHQPSERDAASFVSGLDLRDPRLAALGGMLGEVVGSKMTALDAGTGKLTTTPGMDFCSKLNVPSAASLLPGDLGARIGTTLGDLSSRLSATIGSSGDFGARMGAIVAVDNTVSNGGSTGATDSNNATNGSGPNNSNHNNTSSPIGGGDTVPPDYSRAVSLTSSSSDSSLMARQSIVSACGNPFGGLNRTNTANNATQERLFYNDFFSTAAKKASPGVLGGAGASDVLSPGSNFAYDMSINMVNSLIRQGVCSGDQSHFSSTTTTHSGLQHMGALDGGVSIPKQEVIVDAFPLTSTSTVSQQQHHYSGQHPHDPNKGAVDGRNVNGLFMYGGAVGEDYGGATYGGKLSGHLDAQEAHQRLKLDPYSMPAATLPDNVINTGQHFMQNNSVNNTNSQSHNTNNNNGENNDVSLPSMNSEIINDQEVFSCTHCLYKTPRKNYLKQHLRTHTGEGKVFCPICPYSTVWRQRLKHHVINHQKEKKQRTFPSRSRSVPSDSNNTTDSLLNSNSNSSYIHLNNNNNRLTQNGVVTNPSNVLHSSNINYIGDVGGGGDGEERKRFKCEYCPYSTGNKNYLKQHTRTHTGDGTISCPDCNYKSVWRQRMKRHIMSHRGEKEASCTHCSYSTFDKEKLAKHIEAHGDEVYTCTICNFTTQRKTYMKQHTRTHTGEGKVQCPHCPYQTVWKQRLKLHVKKHMNEPGGSSIPRNVARLHCPHCDFKSCRKDRLRNHMRIHTAELFRCDLCPYTSASSDLLRHHAETHTNEGGDSSAGGNSSSLFGIADQRSLDGVSQDVKNIGLLAAAAAARGGMENEADDYSRDVGDIIDVKHVPLADFEGYDTSYHGEQGAEGGGRMEAERESLIQRINEMTESARGSPSSCGSPVAGGAPPPPPSQQDNLRMSLFRSNREGLQEYVTNAAASSVGHDPGTGPELTKRKKKRKTGGGDSNEVGNSDDASSDGETEAGFCVGERSSVPTNGDPSSSVNYTQNEARRPDYCHSDTVTNPNYCHVTGVSSRPEHPDPNRFAGAINNHSLANGSSSTTDQNQTLHSGNKFTKLIPDAQMAEHRQYPLNGSEMGHMHRHPPHHQIGFPTPPPPPYADPNGEHSLLLGPNQHLHTTGKKTVVQSQFDDNPCGEETTGLAACGSGNTASSTEGSLSYRGSNNERGDSYGSAATAMGSDGAYGSGGMVSVISGFSQEPSKEGTVN